MLIRPRRTITPWQDFIFAGDYVELKLPWQRLNFADPSRRTIHDDYYNDNYGVAYITIDTLYLGLADDTEEGRIALHPDARKGWGHKVTYHERLKAAYYAMQALWR